MTTCSFTLSFKNKVQLLPNSSLLSDIYKACTRTKPFQNIKSLKKHSIHGNKVQITLSVKNKLSKNQLNDAVKNVIHLLKKKKYQFKSTKTMKGGGKKNRRSTRKTRKQNGGQLKGTNSKGMKRNVQTGDIISFHVMPDQIENINSPYGESSYELSRVPVYYHWYIYNGKKPNTNEVNLKSTTGSAIIYFNYKNKKKEVEKKGSGVDTPVDINKIIPESIKIEM